MKNEINIAREERGNFTWDFFMRQLGTIDEELKAKVTNSMMSFIEYYTNEINFRIMDEEDARNLFNNIQYIMSMYAYKNPDIDVKSEVFDSYSYIKRSYKFYKDEITNLRKAIDNLYKINPLNKLPEVGIYIERLKITLKAYENLISCNLNNQQIEFMPITFKGDDYPFFTMVSDAENGFYEFGNVIFKVMAQFEFFALFDENTVISVYQNLNFDITEKGEPYKYPEILRPVLQQYLFCCEYSAEPLSLNLTTENVKRIGVDMKIFAKKVQKEAKYYIISDENYKLIMEFINTSSASEFYKDKLYKLVGSFKHNFDISSEGSVLKVSIFEKMISKLKESRGFEKNFDLSYEIIDIITEHPPVTILYEEDAIDDDYMDILIKSLKSDSGFKTLSSDTQEYILKNVPDVRNSLLMFKKMKNIAFLV